MKDAGEILSTSEMSEADRLTIASGPPGISLMEAAGAAVARAVLRHPGQSVGVLCGPGNNGGDGFIAARLLREAGRTVSVGLIGRVDARRGDAAEAAARWNGDIATIMSLDLGDCDIIVDALFGAGLSRDLDGLSAAIVGSINAWRNQSGRIVIAVDVPSGLDGNSGQICGASIEADETITFFRAKPGHFLLPGRTLCGHVEIAEIGIAPDVLEEIAPQTFRNAPALWREAIPKLGADSHKYTRGHALVCSGPATQTGASRLSARAALRAGAGLVTLAGDEAALRVHAAHVTAIMLMPCEAPRDLVRALEDPRKNCVVIGPGFGVGQDTRDMVQAAFSPSLVARAVVLDADALTSFAGQAQALVDCMGNGDGPVVLTPHEGEFARLFGNETRDEPLLASRSKLERARIAASLTGAHVILKGADTIVAAPDGRASIACDLPPCLATAGSGDVLAGIVAGLLAQGMEAFAACSAAVWLHGAAGRKFGRGMISEDLPDALPGVFAELGL